MIEVYPNEAWCPHCHVSHVPGTKRCMHCGGGVMPMRPVEGAPAAVLMRAPGELPGAPELGGDEGGEEAAQTSRVSRPLRFGVASIWVVLAVIGAIMRTCAERG